MNLDLNLWQLESIGGSAVYTDVDGPWGPTHIPSEVWAEMVSRGYFDLYLGKVDTRMLDSMPHPLATAMKAVQLIHQSRGPAGWGTLRLRHIVTNQIIVPA